MMLAYRVMSDVDLTFLWEWRQFELGKLFLNIHGIRLELAHDVDVHNLHQPSRKEVGVDKEVRIRITFTCSLYTRSF
jgi:hypothetical protein